MKAALIPPIPLLPHFGRGDFHLLLSHLVENKKYREHYRWQRNQGAYLVLDNSAHEAGAGESAERLLDQGVLLNVQEIVVPDTLEDYEATVEGTVSAWEVWSKSATFHLLNPTLMYVPQGATVEDWRTCLIEQSRIHHYATHRRNLRSSFVVGISKDYEVWEGGLDRLIEEHAIPVIRAMAHQGIDVQVHLLGWGRDLLALKYLALNYPWVRSTDSAKPFVYAMKGIRLSIDMDDSPKYPKRPLDYFSKTLRGRKELAAHNCTVFQIFAEGGVMREQVS